MCVCPQAVIKEQAAFEAARGALAQALSAASVTSAGPGQGLAACNTTGAAQDSGKAGGRDTAPPPGLSDTASEAGADDN